jgi:hypothetical protein
MITLQKQAKIIYTVSITYRDIAVRIRVNRWRLCESSVSLSLAVVCQAASVNKYLEIGRGHFEYYL